MTFDDFIRVLPPEANWAVKMYEDYKNTGIKPEIIKLVEAFFDNINIFEGRINSEVWQQIYIITATGDNLDKHGAELGISRNSDDDTTYRIRLLTYIEILKKGSTIETIRLIIETLGYTIDRIEENIFYSFYTDETGVSEFSYTGYNTMTGCVGEQNWINYTTYFYLTPTPSQSSIDYLENIIKNVKKLYNRVFIR